ncbi:MAG: dihydroorotase [Kiritimatiellae bacterium]|nr:dihydroorotase [Kiritimatiellia bacterium]
MSTAIQLYGVRVVDPCAGRDAVGDVCIAGGRLVAPCAAAQRVAADGLALLPGLTDVHVHFRDPGGIQAEDLASGSHAAARGGFTRVVTMPNTQPPCDAPELVRRQLDPALPVRILPSACLTRARRGAQPADMASLAATGAVAFTDDGSTVADDAVMAAAMRAARATARPVMDHAIDPHLAGDGIVRDSPLARRLALPVMDPEAEVAAVRRDIRLARESGCRLHIQHVSCAGSLEAIRAAQRAGLPVTAEATPHHLLLAAEDLVEDDGNWRMNPPLGSRADREALRAAVLDGTVGILATDHAPHAPDTKCQGYARAPSGVIGLETALGVTYLALVEQAGQTLLDLVARWTVGPVRLLGLPPPSLAADGQPADLTLVDFATPWTVEPARFAGKSRNCPFAGMRLRGRPLMTVCGGRLTWLDPSWAAADAVRRCWCADA